MLTVNFILVDKKSLLFYESTMCTLSDAYITCLLYTSDAADE